MTVTVGASCASVVRTPSDLLGEADTALYEAKRAGRDRVQVFDQRVHRRNRDRLTRQGALRRAIDAGRAGAALPAEDLPARPGRPVAAEALIRWQHPTDGLLPPYDFLPARRGQPAHRRHRRVGPARGDARRRRGGSRPADAPADEDRPTADINVSGRHLTHPSLLRHVDAALDASGLDPARVELEITETVLLQDLELAARVLEAVRDRGHRHRAGRLRHRLLVAHLAAAAAGGHRQARPQLHRGRPVTPGRVRDGHPQRRHRPRPCRRQDGHRRGGRDDGAARAASSAWAATWRRGTSTAVRPRRARSR